MSSSRKTSLQDFQHQIKDIKSQLLDQGKCLEQKTETQVAILHEVQDFLRKRAELDQEYAGKLDKLVKSAMLKHKSDRQKRANWPLYSTCTLWQQLVDGTKDEAKQRGITAEVYGEHLNHSITARCTVLHKISKRCREIGVLAQGEIIRVLNELAASMKTYQTSYDELSAVSTKYQQAEQAVSKYNDPAASTVSSRKKKAAQKSHQKVHEKYLAAKNKCDRARNEYLLCVDAANSSLHKFFADDVSDLIDCSDLGMEHWLNLILCNVIAARKAACQMEMNSLANLDSFKESLTTQLDKRRFFECNSAAYMLPRLFEFKCESTEHVNSISLDDGLRGELRERSSQIKKRLGTLRAESDATWKTLEQTEMDIKATLNAMIGMEITEYGIAEQNRPRGENLDGELGKLTEAYLVSFNYYLLNANLIARLEARHDGIGNALINNPQSDAQGPPDGGNNHGGAQGSNGGDTEEVAEYYRRKRLGSRQTSITTSTDPTTGAPSHSSPNRRRARLFGGSLEEYVQSTGEAIPLIVTSCIRVLSRFALHHQGVFRVSGSQVEINNFKDAFEAGEDPLQNVQDGSDVNSIAGVLKLFLRELREPLFPIYLFDLLTDCAKCASNQTEFINQISPLMTKLPRANYLLLRYLFAFLNHLSEFYDENMMDTYNLAICFGPTLLPIPEGKDQVYYQNYVNEVVKNLIVHCDLIFASRVPGPRYTKYQTMDAIAAAALSAERSDIDTYVDESDSALEFPAVNNHTGTSGSGSGSTARAENISDLFDLNSLSNNGPSARVVAVGNGGGGDADYSFGPLRLAPMNASINSHTSTSINSHNFAAGRIHPAQQQHQVQRMSRPSGAAVNTTNMAATYAYSSSEENLINSGDQLPPTNESHISPQRGPPTGRRVGGGSPPGRLPTRYNSVDHYHVRGGQQPPLGPHRQQSYEPELKSYTFLRSPIKSPDDGDGDVGVVGVRQHSPQRVTSPTPNAQLMGSVSSRRDAFLRHFQSASLDTAAAGHHPPQTEPTTNGGGREYSGGSKPLRIPVAPKPAVDGGIVVKSRNVIVSATPTTYGQLYAAVSTSPKRQLAMTSPTALISPPNATNNVDNHSSASTVMASSSSAATSNYASSRSSPTKMAAASSTASSTTSTAKSMKAGGGAALPPHGRAENAPNRRVDA